MRTFKEHKINDRTFQEELFYQVEINSKFQGYRRVFNLFVKSIDFKPNKKSGKKSPHKHDKGSSMAAMLMIEPKSKYSKAFSEHYGEDFWREPIKDFRIQSDTVVGILDEIAAKRAELVDKTPFDVYDDNLALKVFDERLKEIYSLILSNPDITRQYVEEAILPMQDMLESMDDKLNILLPKKRKERQILPLRDPVYTELYEVFLAAAGSSSKYKQNLKCAQLKIAYTILFYVGLRVNEMRFFQEKNIQDAIKTSQC